MNLKFWLLIVGLLPASAFAVRGDDTPFLEFRCSFGKTLESKTFSLKLANDDTPEAWFWKDDWKHSVIRFEKRNHQVAVVRISTGLPLVGYAAPEEYRFTAPLGTGGFEFTLTQKLVGGGSERVSLICKEPS